MKIPCDLSAGGNPSKHSTIVNHAKWCSQFGLLCANPRLLLKWAKAILCFTRGHYHQAKMEFGNHQKWKMTFSQKFFGFDNIVQNQQNGLTFFYQWNKIATLHKSRILQAVQKLRVFVGGFRTPQKGSQSRSNFRKCIISRVVSFLLLELLVVWRYTKIWRPYELAASKQKIGQIIDSLSSKQHRARPGLQNDAANCN